MKSIRKSRFSSFAGIIAIPVFVILFLALSGNKEVYGQSPLNTSPAMNPGVTNAITGTGEERQKDDLCTFNSIRRCISERISYPQEAVKSGYTGTVELFARVNNDGSIGEVLQAQPSISFRYLDEIVIVGNLAAGVNISESSRHESLISESRRVIMSLPRLDIPEVHGGILKFTFKFVLQ